MGCVCRYRDLPLYCVIGINTWTQMCGILKSLSLLIGLCKHTSYRCVLKCKMVFAKDASCNTNRLMMGFWFSDMFLKKILQMNTHLGNIHLREKKKKKDFALLDPFTLQVATCSNF